MNSERLKMLEKFRLEEPGDPFNSYALALEYQNTHPKKAMELFELLLNTHPDYIPTYYHAGNFFAERGDPARAFQILTTGLEKSKNAADIKTQREIQGLLEILGDSL